MANPALANAKEIEFLGDEARVNRVCIMCQTPVWGMGVYVFVTNGTIYHHHPRYVQIGSMVYAVILCPHHGSNGGNVLDKELYDECIAKLPGAQAEFVLYDFTSIGKVASGEVTEDDFETAFVARVCATHLVEELKARPAKHLVVHCLNSSAGLPCEKEAS